MANKMSRRDALKVIGVTGASAFLMQFGHRFTSELSAILGGNSSQSSYNTDTWATVTPPAGWTWQLPFAIQQSGDSFQIDPAFDLKAYAGITVAKTYFVKLASEGGNDKNTGLDEAHAFATVHKALTKTDCDCIMVKSGVYDGFPSKGWNGSSIARSMMIIAYGGPVILSMDVSSGLTWTPVGNHYEAPYASSISSVHDGISPDEFGDDIPLAWVKTVALVDSTPGSFFYTSGSLYVHTIDSRVPDSKLHCEAGSSNGRLKYPVTYYVEGISFYGGSQAFNANYAGNGMKLYMKNCQFKYSAANSTQDCLAISGGGGEVILQGCTVARGDGDAFKMQPSGAYTSNLAMIDCEGRYCGLPSSTNSNGYSRHGPGSTVAINSTFHHTYGPSFRDINNGTLTWMLKCNNHHPLGSNSPTANTNFSMGNTSTCWLDTCTSSGLMSKGVDLYPSEAGSTINYRNMTPASPTHTGPGKIIPY